MIRLAACLALLASVASHPATAEEFPTRPVTIVSPYQAGGTSDIIARVVAQKLSETWGQPVLVENRPGANGALGVMAVVRAAPDGYTLLATASSGLTLNPLVYSTLPYSVERDLAPITGTGEVANVLVAHPGVGANTVPELIALAKAKPGALSYGSQGVGSNGHLIGEMFRQRTGVALLHVPYKGSAPALNDLLGGQIQLMFDNLPASLPQIKAGTLKAIAVTTAARDPRLPDVPTIAESGLPGFDATAWFALLTGKGVPEARRAEIERAALAALTAPDVREKLAAAGVDVAAAGSAALADRIARETLMWKTVVDTAKIRLE
ncbi:MAG: tripartite tricarboxylate transporter substrate binding protein [Rhodoplanes sp.]|uniref:Bug family tripartite tricarboxylate transporter substrate binding protein n=1 Tax=Rhodoplanes sp. TaxID=1968906 RepID=UPI0017E2B01D|nr:tripartite tricarboxylate transporter substrate binding protein [Rhodoplanes sp.]NVO16218.1 tripartite tricarboxylate transporter substrate binding protein [Rhodoplanes sp.]